MSRLDIEGVLRNHRLVWGDIAMHGYECACGITDNGDHCWTEDEYDSHVAAVLSEQIAAWLGGIADSDRKEGTRTGSMGLLIIADAEDALAARVAPSRMTHCANCGAEVPVDQPHQVGECVAPSRVPGEES